ncbi:VOC family protein [Oceanibium sediminis]|uniref:VOC family protein n=1 Tax=Oceanibium sediminis TaxID=2026339 RepID=UPI000DD2E61C|nr:VOC family protein [Oceanibium sediminis]
MIFRYTIFYVEDVAASLDFFERAFGFERTFLHESGDYGELATGTTKLAFSSTALMRQLGKTPAAPEPAAPTFEIAFETDDVSGALRRALDAGATLIQDVRDEPWGQTTSYVADPNGYLIEICSAVQMPG